MPIIKNNIPDDYHPLDHISDGMEMAFLHFVDSDIYTKLKEIIFTETAFKPIKNLISWFIFFWLPYKEVKDKVVLTRKDLILFWFMYNLSHIIDDKGKAKRYGKHLERLYFNGKEDNPRFDRLLFYIAATIDNRPIDVYIYDKDILRIATPSQHISAETIQPSEFWFIQVNFNEIVNLSLKWQNAPKRDWKLFTLNDEEIALLFELRLAKYKQDKVIINFDNKNAIKELRVFWKEYDLDRHAILKEIITHWDLWHKIHKGKAQYIKISEIIPIAKKKK